MTFQSFSKQLLGNPAAIFLRRIVFYTLELYLLLILITKSAFLISIAFDNFFTGLFERFFSLIFDNFISDDISNILRGTTEETTKDIEIPTIWNYVGNYIGIFYTNLKEEPNALLKITMIFKSLILFSFVFLMIYHVTIQSIKSLRYKWVVLIFLKVLAVFIFLITGAATFLALIDSGSFFEYGTLFSLNMVRSCFAQQKLLILFVFLTAGRDVILQAAGSMRK